MGKVKSDGPTLRTALLLAAILFLSGVVAAQQLGLAR